MKALAGSIAFVLMIAFGTLGLVGQFNGGMSGAPHLATTIPAATWQAPVEPPAATARPTRSGLAASLPTRTMAPSTMEVASLPLAAPSPTARARPIERLEAWSAPAPLPTPAPTRKNGCDPAYPDEETCIPPGPPFDQGCAITKERLFTVLPPDPQRLDHDGDGIGCEPI